MSFFSSNRDTQRPPGPSGLPVLQNTHQVLFSDVMDLMTRVSDDYGGVSQLTAGTNTMVLVTDPDVLDRILIEDADAFEKGNLQKSVADDFLGGGLVFSEGEKWRNDRHDIEPVFHPDLFQHYTDVIDTQIDIQLSDWADGENRQLLSEMQELTLAILADAMFGVDIRNEYTQLGTAFNGVSAFFESKAENYVSVPKYIPTPKNRRYKRQLRELKTVIDEIIEENRGESDQPTLISHLLGLGWDTDDIRQQVQTFLFAGHQTPSLLVSYCLYLLGQNPEALARVHDILDDTADGAFTETVRNDEYIDRVFRESMRLYPPVYAIFRSPLEDVYLDGYLVEEGSVIVLPQWVVHRDEQWYPDPERFDPGRWTDERRTQRPSGAYFPFGAGPRRCVGERFGLLESKLILGRVLRDYDIDLRGPDTLDIVPSLTTQPADDIVVELDEK